MSQQGDRRQRRELAAGGSIVAYCGESRSNPTGSGRHLFAYSSEMRPGGIGVQQPIGPPDGPIDQPTDLQAILPTPYTALSADTAEWWNTYIDACVSGTSTACN